MNSLLLSISKANNHLLKEDSIDNALNFCISDIGAGQDIDRCYIFKNRVEDGDLKLFYVYEWCNENVVPYFGDPELNGISYDALPGLYSYLSQDEAMYGLVKDSDNELFKRVMDMQGIKSYLFTPIFSNNSFWGWIGYDDCRNEREWLQEEVYALHTVAKNIGLRLTRDSTLKVLERTSLQFNYCMLSAKQALWEFDIANNKVIISHNWAGMLGYDNDQIIDPYRFFIKKIHLNDKTSFERNLKDFIAERQPIYDGILRLKHKKGYYIWVKYSGLLEKNEEGVPIRIIGTHIDVSDIKEKEYQLKLSEEKFKFLVSNSKDLICQHEVKGNFTYVSDSSLEILGFSPETIMKKNLLDLIHPKDIKNIKSYYKSVIKNKQNGVITFRVRNIKGKNVWLETATKIIVDSGNKLTGFQTSSRDITDRVRADKEIKTAMLKEKRFYELKSNFIAMASHQFRTPLTVIYSNSELLELKIKKFGEVATHQFNAMTSRIKNEVDRMTLLMDNILVFGKYESKAIEKKIEPIDFNVFIETLLETYFNATSYKIDVQTTGKKRLFYSDESLMVHILSNLLSNAFKYSLGQTNPLLNITYGAKEIVIEVVDYGIGIPEKDLEHLYTSFFRSSNTGTIIGSGLGLVIVKQFTEFLSGTIEITSKEHHGTTVKLTFPYEQK